MSEPRLVEVRRNVLKQNDVIARALRERFRTSGVFVVSLVSSPGSGKTTFLEKTLIQLQPRYRVAALLGDLATENDATRLARSHAPVKQITTGTLCHLEAAMVQQALEGWDLQQLDFLFIENVGNLVCPSSYDLGENLRLVLMSVTEGEDKPLKYPTIFNSADVTVVTNSFAIAEHLVRHSRCTVIMPEGTVDPGSQLILNTMSPDPFANYKVKKAFMGIEGITETALTNSDPLLIQMERAMIAHAQELIILADETKFGKMGHLILCPIEKAAQIITSLQADASLVRTLRDRGIEVVQV